MQRPKTFILKETGIHHPLIDHWAQWDGGGGARGKTELLNGMQIRV